MVGSAVVWGANPIRRVVTLLQDMQKEIQVSLAVVYRVNFFLCVVGEALKQQNGYGYSGCGLTKRIGVDQRNSICIWVH